MKQYIVVYDNVDAQHRETITNKIKSYGAWARISDNVWYLRTNTALTVLRDGIYPEGNNDCRVFVVEVASAPWASYNLSKEVTDWLKSDK